MKAAPGRAQPRQASAGRHSRKRLLRRCRSPVPSRITQSSCGCEWPGFASQPGIQVHSVATGCLRPAPAAVEEARCAAPGSLPAKHSCGTPPGTPGSANAGFFFKCHQTHNKQSVHSLVWALRCDSLGVGTGRLCSLNFLCKLSTFPPCASSFAIRTGHRRRVCLLRCVQFVSTARDNAA